MASVGRRRRGPARERAAPAPGSREQGQPRGERGLELPGAGFATAGCSSRTCRRLVVQLALGDGAGLRLVGERAQLQRTSTRRAGRRQRPDERQRRRLHAVPAGDQPPVVLAEHTPCASRAGRCRPSASRSGSSDRPSIAGASSSCAGLGGRGAMSMFSTGVGRVHACRPGPARVGQRVVPHDHRDPVALLELAVLLVEVAVLAPRQAVVRGEHDQRVGDRLAPSAWTTACTWRSTSRSDSISLLCSLSRLSRNFCRRVRRAPHVVRVVAEVGRPGRPVDRVVVPRRRRGPRARYRHDIESYTCPSPVAGTASGCGAKGARYRNSGWFGWFVRVSCTNDTAFWPRSEVEYCE